MLKPVVETRRATSRASAPPASCAASARPLIAHVIYRLNVGGLENGLVNLINRLPEFRHAVLCMTDYTDFRRRITHPRTSVHALRKRPGQDAGVYLRIWKLLRELRPDIVHTRNLSALEAQLPAWLAGVRARVHGEHGRDYPDVHGTLKRYQWLRRTYKPLVGTFVPLSRELEQYLLEKVKVPARRVQRIYNGVDTLRFRPRWADTAATLPPGFAPPGAVVIGTVGRMEEVKDQITLVQAFLLLLEEDPARRRWLRLALIGDGSLLPVAKNVLAEAQALDLAWCPGSRDDIPDMLRAFDVFVLPSRGEGISNTILEAMASGLPVVATDVGGNPELVEPGVTGALVPAAEPRALATALRSYLADAALRRAHGAQARARVEERFSMDAMVQRYRNLYQSMLDEARR